MGIRITQPPTQNQLNKIEQRKNQRELEDIIIAMAEEIAELRANQKEVTINE